MKARNIGDACCMSLITLGLVVLTEEVTATTVESR
jgi:hypothetical protein